MKKNKSKQALLVALTGLFLLGPVRNAYIPQMMEVKATQVSAAHDSKLSAFDIAPGVLSPAFSPDVTEYTSTVDANVTSVSVQAVPRAAASGAVIAAVEGRDGLRPGVNTIKVTCSAADNTYTVYTVTLTVGSADVGAQQPDGNTDADGTQPDTGTTNTDGNAGGTQPGDAENSPQTGADPDQTGASLPDDTPAGGDFTPDDAEDASQPDGSLDTDSAETAKNTKKRSLAERLSGTVKADGTVKLSGAAYQISSGFTYGSVSQDIPSAFGQGSVQIGDNNYSTLYCPSNGVHLVYMENTDGKGATGFYFYDEMKNVVERFKYVGTDENFVIFISNARQEVPAGYGEKTLKLPSGKKAAAYQSQFSDELKDYYLVFGIYSDGTSGWYLYDKKQGTYLRYSDAFASYEDQEEDGKEEVERTVSLTKYNTLNEKYTELKDSRVKIVSILVVAIVLLIIIFTALLLRGHDDDEDDTETDAVGHGRKKRPKKAGRQSEPISKSSLAAGRSFEGNVSKRSKKVTKTFTQDTDRQPQVRASASSDHISTPEEIRAQVSRGQAGQKQRQNDFRGLAGEPASPETMQMAAERMRQSVKYTRKAPKAEPQAPEHDPMDDWDMEESAGRRPQKSGKSLRKKRARQDEDMEIMDLNDL